MIGSLGRGIRFGSKSGISAGRDPVNLCLCEPSQWFGGDGHEIFAPNFQLELELRSMFSVQFCQSLVKRRRSGQFLEEQFSTIWQRKRRRPRFEKLRTMILIIAQLRNRDRQKFPYNAGDSSTTTIVSKSRIIFV
ncbi:hypothetical protein T01_14845 [Trichinella spiralis]|uniref:Uncharacterized protein n=1 Tax=Trichinella spiralis TaxID=6334 RepID=A0A0V1AZ25_TRISP|nr:hypothetical protein T01_14845 [Trichinella spiralis]